MPTPKAPHATFLLNSFHHPAQGSVAKGKTNPHRRIEVTLHLRRVKELPDLSSLALLPPKQRKYATRDQLKNAYGSDPAAIKKIEAFAAAHHLVITRDERASATLSLSGTVADMNSAFGVTLLDYEHPTLGKFHAHTGPVQIPPELVGDVKGVTGLNNQRHLRRRRNPRDGVTLAASNGVARPWFMPTELAEIYNFPQADASGQCIGLLEFGGGVETQDIPPYFQKLGIPEPSVQVVAVDGVSIDAPADPESTGEVMLDVDVVGALGSGAKLVVYFSTFDEKGLIDCLSTVIADSTNKPSVLSISWGWDENQPFQNGILWSPAAIDHINESFLAIAQLGLTVCVSTGDDGSEAQIKDGNAHVNFPATSPYVLAVGGTSLHSDRSLQGDTVVSEVVWNNGPGSGTGGGVSDVTPAPNWQEGIVPVSINQGNFAGRAIPDIAANADPATGYLSMSGGNFDVVGGTSAAAPLWAALIARINAALGAPVGNFNALLYTRFGPTNVLRDIVDGNNDTDGLLDGRFAAGTGWDACTGWGVPDGGKLLAAFKVLSENS